MSETLGEAFGKLEEDLKRINQRLARLEQGARQPRLPIEADVIADRKTRERTEGAAATAQVKHAYSCFAKGSKPARNVRQVSA